jgi:DNA-binding response OmpR family regulator
METKMEKSNESKSTIGGQKILLIDDDPDYVKTVKLLLEKKYEVMTAFSAQEGWEKIEKQRPDLILLDAMMEPKDGFTMAKELKEHQEHKNIPIVMLTGMVPQIPSTKYSQDQILRFDGADFVEKSSDVNEILTVVEKYLKCSG